ncbi:MAG: hypothetical protein BWK73_04560 [Thiothrix lacustris]|uniref:Uncharacterized protein n=1 Tax=Thiothrix lacustris TaxID=525917 RepID=A0A1Y1QXF8_9GAMM|nr:MAG: hypothetical protein BWK73_04560 [Thiothrix lacustris]
MGKGDQTRILTVGGEMTAEETAKIMKIHAYGDVLNNAIWRFGVLVLLWRSPDLANVFIRLFP